MAASFFVITFSDVFGEPWFVIGGSLKMRDLCYVGNIWRHGCFEIFLHQLPLSQKEKAYNCTKAMNFGRLLSVSFVCQAPVAVEPWW